MCIRVHKNTKIKCIAGSVLSRTVRISEIDNYYSLAYIHFKYIDHQLYYFILQRLAKLLDALRLFLFRRFYYNIKHC